MFFLVDHFIPFNLFTLKRVKPVQIDTAIKIVTIIKVVHFPTFWVAHSIARHIQLRSLNGRSQLHGLIILRFIHIICYNQPQVQMQKHTSLYVREFFNNYLNNQRHTDTLNLLNSSLEVLDDFINQFMLKHSIPVNPMAKGLSRNASQQQNFNYTFERLYEKLSSAFQWVDKSLKNHEEKNEGGLEGLSQIRQQQTGRSFNLWSQANDQELYQILNEYKSSNKKMKENINALSQKLEGKNAQILQLRLKKQIAQKEVGYLNLKIEELQDEVKDMVETMEEKDREIEEKTSLVSQLRTQVDSNANGISLVRQSNEKLERKLLQLQTQLSKKDDEKRELQIQLAKRTKENREVLDKKLNEISLIIQSKLKSKESWQVPAVEVLKKFIKYRETTKENANGNRMAGHP